MNPMTRCFVLCLTVISLAACFARRQPPAASNAETPVPAATAAVASQPASQPSTASPAASTAAGTATKSGWWIRIHPSLTTAQSITLQIGTSKLQREEWRVWRAGEPVEFDVPANYQQLPRLYVRGNVTPIGKYADLCVMYKNRGVEHMGFDDDDSDTATQMKTDLKCR
jgi:hypothetical protein